MVVLLRLLNFWISFKGESVVDLIIYCGAVWLVRVVTWGGGIHAPSRVSSGLHTLCSFFHSKELIINYRPSYST
jgi:hypothetical protein